MIKNRKKIWGRMVAVTAAFSIIMASVIPAHAESSVTWKIVSQSINSENQYVYDGSKTDSTMPGLVVYKASGIWGYVNDGQVQTAVSGLYANNNGWFKIENGWVNFSAAGLQQAGTGWYSFSAGERVWTDNGIVLQNSSGWWYIADGKVDFSYQGFAGNSHGVWWVGPQAYAVSSTGGTKGKVNFNANGVEKDSTNAIDGGWYYVSGGCVDFAYTGIAQNSAGWWYIKNGKVDFSYNGASVNDSGIWYIKNGKVDFSYNGYAYGFRFSGGKAY